MTADQAPAGIRLHNVDGNPWALRVPAGSLRAERPARYADRSRARRADQRRLSAIIDDRAHVAEAAEIVTRLNAPTLERLAGRSATRDRNHAHA